MAKLRRFADKTGSWVKHKSNLDRAMRRIDIVAKQRMIMVAKMLQEHFRHRLTGPRFGRTWTIRTKDGTGWMTYTASRKREWPAERYGDLIKSMDYKYLYDDHVHCVYFGSNIEYAKDIEGKRPFIKRGMIEATPDILRIISAPYGAFK